MKKNLATIITRKQVEDALEYIEQNNIAVRHSTSFDLLYKGKKYPPKEVVREAAKLSGIVNLFEYRLNGGPPTNNPLEKLGFKILAKNEVISNSNPATLVNAIAKFLDDTPYGTPFGTYNYTEKSDKLVMGSVGGAWDPQEYPGYIFSNNTYRWLFRFVAGKDSSHIVVESVHRGMQLANYKLVNNETFIKEGNVNYLYENYKMTVGTTQSFENSRKAMLQAGFSNDDIILTYDSNDLDENEIIQNLLEWAEIKEKAKNLIRYNSVDSTPEFQSNPNLQEMPHLNTILHGPPGTGKTFYTINKALEIIDPKYFFDNKHDRSKLTKRFKELLITDWANPNGKIAFITFHQGTSYEDFIEGIKPDVIEGDDGEAENITYVIKDGIFKLIAQKASWRKGNFDEIFGEFINSINELKEKKPLTISSKYTTFDVVFRETTTLYVKPQSSRKENAWYPVSMVNIRKVYETGNYDGIYNLTYVREILQYLKSNKGLVEPTKNTSEVPEPHVIIIDEINRGNIAQIFGELITLLEPDKRSGEVEELEVILPYSKKPFVVPSNLFVIGTMNTADRSVEALDTALRRRFHFEEMPPRSELLSSKNLVSKLWWDYKAFGWEFEKFKKQQAELYNLVGFPLEFRDSLEKDKLWGGIKGDFVPRTIDDVDLKSIVFSGLDMSQLLKKINKRIEKLLGKDYMIGHAYLINVRSIDDLKSAFFNKIIPLLQEYFYGDYGRIGLVIGSSFLEIAADNEVEFMKVDGYETGDLRYNKVYRIKGADDFKDETFVTAIKQIYA